MYLIMALRSSGWEEVDTANSVAEKNHSLKMWREANPGARFKAVRS